MSRKGGYKEGHADSSLNQKQGPVDASIGHSVTSINSLDINRDDNIIVKVLYRENTTIKISEDINIQSEEGDINGAIVDVYQLAEIFQSSTITVKVKERCDNIIVKINVLENTKINLDTDIDVLMTNEAEFDVNIVQTVNIVQDKSTQIKIQGDININIDLLLSQIAEVDQDASVAFQGSVDDFTVSVDADQDVYATQQITLDMSAEDLLIA